MGKGRNKNKDRDENASATGGGRARNRIIEDDFSDTESVSTHITLDDDLRSVQGNDEMEDDATSLLDALSEYMDNATNKTSSIRMAALRHLYLGLTSNYVGQELERYKATLADLACRALKKGDDEFVAGAHLISVVAIQLGEEAEVDEALSLLCPIVTDSARPLFVRSTAATAIGVIARLACDSEDVYGVCIKALADTWSSFKVGAQYTSLFCSSLSAWCLLLEKAPWCLQSAIAQNGRLVSYVEGNQLEMRVSAGEALAYLYELVGRLRGEDFRFPNHEHLCGILRELASESGKGKTKKDKRVQKLSQIYALIADGDAPSLEIKLDKESLDLDSCAYKLLYEQLTEILRGGMRRQLKMNLLLRDMFDMGQPLQESVTKMSKQDRMAVQNSVSKMRDQQRAKQRDKRAC